MKKVKLALVGCGGIAEAHLRGIQQPGSRIDVAAAVDVDGGRAQSIAERTGATAYTRLEDALADPHVDAVDIMLPHSMHEAAAVLALEAGKHVVLEKPMAPTLEGCERILAAAAAAATVFMVAEQSQYWPDAIRVARMIEAGAIGQIVTAHASFGGAAGNMPVGTTVDDRPWRYDLALAGGGIAMDGGAHWIRPLRMWLGEIAEVVAIADHPFTEMEGESLVRALLRFDSGTVATFNATRAGSVAGPGEDFRVTGTTGELLIEKGRQGRLLHYHPACREGEVVLSNKHEGREASFGAELEDFASAILDGTELVAGPEVSLGELRTALAMYRSAQSRQWERVWD